MEFLYSFESRVKSFNNNRNNKLSKIPQCILGMTSLEELDLSGNCIQDVPTDLGSLKKLRNFFLNKNQISNIGKSLE